MNIVGWKEELTKENLLFLRKKFLTGKVSKILDIGGISGNFFVENGFSLTNIDDRFILSLSPSTSMFDAILCSSLCWHTKSGGEFLIQEIEKLLHKNGFLFLKVPKRETVLASIENSRKKCVFFKKNDDWTFFFSDTSTEGGIVRGFSRKDLSFLKEKLKVTDIICENGAGLSILARKK